LGNNAAYAERAKAETADKKRNAETEKSREETSEKIKNEII